jgi:putative DNA methylase
MIERWFPCAEVSHASAGGWGTGNSEAGLFTWFAKRPLAQAKAAVLTSLLPWPEDETEQRRLQDLVRRSMSGYDSARTEIETEFIKHYGGVPAVLDPFSGRGMIPLEAARMGARSFGIDYSPLAALASQLLAEYPLRDWSDEPDLPYDGPAQPGFARLVDDVRAVLDEIARRYEKSVSDFYPRHEGKTPWGYVWAVTLPCQECGRRFPLTGSLVLRHPLLKKGDPGQSYRIEVDRAEGTFRAVVHDGPPTGQPTLAATTRAGKKGKGKAAVCPFCEHSHPKDTHQRLAAEGQGQDALIIAADLDTTVGKIFREPTTQELLAVGQAEEALTRETAFGPGLPAVPDEVIPESNGATIRPQLYGAKTYGDLCNRRQTLSFVRLARIINVVGQELLDHGHSPDYASALIGYASSVVVRKLKYSTRGAALQPRKDAKSNRVMIGHIFVNEATVAFSYDYFETALGDGPGTWRSLTDDTVHILRKQLGRRKSLPAHIARGSALSLPFRPGTFEAVVTDPPYDAMVYYSDSSDLFYVWLKRSLQSVRPDLTFTTDPRGVQEKTEELLVKEHGVAIGEHRTRAYYDAGIARAFAEAHASLRPDGVVTIVFGHGEPEVWHRLLGAITRAGLVLTGSWPARTESGGQQGKANIVTTLTMSCRPAPSRRPTGRANAVEAQVQQEVQSRIPIWDAAGLAPADQLMASAGPAMEAVGRYAEVLSHVGEPVDPSHYLVIARKAVIDASSVPIENLPLDTFDARTRFALAWVRLYRRSAAAKSEARWQALAADLAMSELKGILMEADKGVRFAPATESKVVVGPTSSVIDVAMAMAKAWPGGLDEVVQVLAAAQRDEDDAYLWATLGYLSSLLPEADPDAVAWNSLVRARRGIGNVTRRVVSAKREADEVKDRQRSLFDLDPEGETP